MVYLQHGVTVLLMADLWNEEVVKWQTNSWNKQTDHQQVNQCFEILDQYVKPAVKLKQPVKTVDYCTLPVMEFPQQYITYSWVYQQFTNIYLKGPVD